MKKLLTIILGFILLISFASCNDSNNDKGEVLIKEGSTRFITIGLAEPNSNGEFAVVVSGDQNSTTFRYVKPSQFVEFENRIYVTKLVQYKYYFEIERETGQIVRYSNNNYWFIIYVPTNYHTY